MSKKIIIQNGNGSEAVVSGGSSEIKEVPSEREYVGFINGVELRIKVAGKELCFNGGLVNVWQGRSKNNRNKIALNGSYHPFQEVDGMRLVSGDKYLIMINIVELERYGTGFFNLFIENARKKEKREE